MSQLPPLLAVADAELGEPSHVETPPPAQPISDSSSIVALVDAGDVDEYGYPLCFARSRQARDTRTPSKVSSLARSRASSVASVATMFYPEVVDTAADDQKDIGDYTIDPNPKRRKARLL